MSWRAACSELRPCRVREQRAPARRRPRSRARRSGRLAADGGLDQAQPRVVRPLAHELGVERERAAAGPRQRRVSRAPQGRGLEFRRRSSPPYYAHAAAATQGSMTRLLSSLAQIALLRKDPSGLPSSWASVAVFVLAYAAADVVVAWLDERPAASCARTAVDLALALAFFWLPARAHAPDAPLPADDQSPLFGVYVLLAPVDDRVAAAAGARRESNDAIALLVDGRLRSCS